MRFALVCCALFFSAVDAQTLNELLDERTEINLQYKKEYTEAASEMTYAKQLTAYEAGVADAWLDLIKYAKASDSNELKQIVLRMEYYDELRSFGYEMEYAETDEALQEARAGVEKYMKKLQAIK